MKNNLMIYLRKTLPAVLAILTIMVFGIVISKSKKKGSLPPIQNNSTKQKLTLSPTRTPEVYEITTPNDVGAAVNGGEIFLNVAEPTNRSTVNSPVIWVRGKTLSKATVFINDRETTADKDGNFSLALTIDEGENSIIIVANDSDGNYSEKEVVVKLETMQ